MTRMDWPGLMRVGIGQLGLAPEAFWRLTPAELQIMAGLGQAGHAVFTRARLEALIGTFPDSMKGDGDDRDRQFVRKAHGA